MIEYFYEEGLEINNPLLHSSIFNILFVESLDEISDEDRKKPKYLWLFEDAPLWAYYNHAKSAFQEGQTELDDMEEDFCKKTNRCIDCYEKFWDCECGGGGGWFLFCYGDSNDDFSDDDSFTDVNYPNPKKPKRNMKAYSLYSNANRESIKESHPDASLSQIATLVSDEFKGLNAEERKGWDEKATIDKERFVKEIKAYNEVN